MPKDQSSNASANQQVNGITIATASLGKRFNREWIFRDLTFEFKPGNVYAVTGPNGAGKSTLLQILWGQLPQTSGTLKYHSQHSETSADEIYDHVSIAAPYMDLIDEFTLDEHVRFHFRMKKMRDGFTPDQFAEITYLTEARHKKIGDFSSGMKQRLKLGLALYTRAKIVFLDEPGTNLDSRTFEWYRDQLQKIPSDSLIFIASNDARDYPERAKVVDLMQYKIYKETGVASKF